MEFVGKRNNILDRILFIVFIVFFFILLLGAKSIVCADNTGISTFATIDGSELIQDEEGGDYTYKIKYTYHAPNKVLNGEILMPKECYNGTYEYWSLWVDTYGEPRLIRSDKGQQQRFSCESYTTASSNWASVKATISCNSSCIYDSAYSGGKWSSWDFDGSKFTSYYLLPSCFLFSNNVDVVYYDSGVVRPIKNCVFYGSSPKVVELSDERFKVALGTMYDGYTFTGNDDFVTVYNTQIIDLYISMKDITDTDGNYFWSITYSALEKYMEDDEEYGKILNIPLGEVEVNGAPFNYYKDHEYQFDFSTSGYNFISLGSVNCKYVYYDEYSFSQNYVYGTGQVITDDPNKPMEDMKNEIIESNKELQNTISGQTDAIKEGNETNKGIWGSIKEMLSYINPLSENFFVYKLIELLVDAIKSLFIPSNDFLANWFSELNDTFADQFGILYYPVSVVVSFLSSLNDTLTASEPIINVPAFKFNFFSHDVNIWDSFSYNFNDMLSNDSIKTAHTYYLLFVNVIFTIGLIAYAGKICTEIFGGVDNTLDNYLNNTEDAQLRRYTQKQNIRSQYNANKINSMRKGR